MLTQALNIRAAVHFSRARLRMSGPNVLELPYFHDERVNVRGSYPVPAMVDFQMDTLVIMYMRDEWASLAKELKKNLLDGPRKIRSWYDGFLTLWVLLWTLGELHQSQLEMKRRWSGQVRDAPTSRFLDCTLCSSINQSKGRK